MTIPIGTWVASLLFDVASQRSDEPRVFARGSAELVKTGLVGGAGAAFLGFLDYLKIPKKSAAGVTATTHLALNVTCMALYPLNLAQRERRLHAAGTRDAAVSGNEIGLSLLALSLLGASGWLGGMLSYHFGVRVADERTQLDGLKPSHEAAPAADRRRRDRRARRGARGRAHRAPVRVLERARSSARSAPGCSSRRTRRTRSRGSACSTRSRRTPCFRAGSCGATRAAARRSPRSIWARRFARTTATRTS